jgi:hypothetical protein
MEADMASSTSGSLLLEPVSIKVTPVGLPNPSSHLVLLSAEFMISSWACGRAGVLACLAARSWVSAHVCV